MHIIDLCLSERERERERERGGGGGKVASSILVYILPVATSLTYHILHIIHQHIETLYKGDIIQ